MLCEEKLRFRKEEHTLNLWLQFSSLNRSCLNIWPWTCSAVILNMKKTGRGLKVNSNINTLLVHTWHWAWTTQGIQSPMSLIGLSPIVWWNHWSRITGATRQKCRLQTLPNTLWVKIPCEWSLRKWIFNKLSGWFWYTVNSEYHSPVGH